MNIKVNLSHSIQDGTEVVFRSPVDCSQVTGLKVHYTENGNTASKEFAFADAHGNNVGDIDHLFAENVVVKVILDVSNGMAFVQNADTNAYLEGRFADFSHFGYKYSEAEKEYDLSEKKDKSVMLYLFPSSGGYAAVVSGNGAMKNPKVTISQGYKITKEGREYVEYVPKINKVYIERGITSVCDYFMYKAYHLTDVIFEDSSEIKYLGNYCFGSTKISGEYAFCNLDNELMIDRAFLCCPDLEGITLGVSKEVTENRSITLGYRAFYGCLNLRYFKLDDPLNTRITLGIGAFDSCAKLELFEVQPKKTAPLGFTFLKEDPMGIRFKRWYEDEPGIKSNTAVGDFAKDGWGWDGNKPVNPMFTYWHTDSDNIRSYNDCVAVPKEYDGKSYEMQTPESDSQNMDDYLTARTDIYMPYIGAFWIPFDGGAIRAPYWGSCWLFALMHMWNVIHLARQFDTIEDFAKKIDGTKIAVDKALEEALAECDFMDAIMATGKYAQDYFKEGNEIYATDLPIAISATTGSEIDDQINTILDNKTGEAMWGVCKALGWSGERYTADVEKSWADIKRMVIDSIFAGKPVLFECVGAGPNDTIATYVGNHAVAALGYDAKTDKFKIIDSAWGFLPDEVPMVYWTTFESLLAPSEISSVWIFSKFDAAARITPAPTDAIDAVLDRILAKQNELIGGGA